MLRVSIFLTLSALGLTAASQQVLPSFSQAEITTLPNGAHLSIDVARPPANESFVLRPLEDSLSNFTTVGYASVGRGNVWPTPEVAYIFVIDSSISTNSDDGACGTTLDCVQDFFAAFYNETVQDGSAKLIGIVDFDGDAYITANLLDPSSPDILPAVYQSTSGGSTNCESALDKAAELATDPSNTAKHTVVVFAGDGECNEAYGSEYLVHNAAARLGSTGATVHSIAVGDEVNCTKTDENLLDDIPQNGGRCFSISDPNELDTIIDDILPEDMFGTTLESLDLKINDGLYDAFTGFEVDMDLPEEGPVAVTFRKEAGDLPVGLNTLCVRATARDAANNRAQAEKCMKVLVQGAPTEVPTVQSTAAALEAWEIALIALLPVLALIGIVAIVTMCSRKRSGKEVDIPIEADATIVENDLKMDESKTKAVIV